MRECENVDLRERLPELLNERLPDAERERVLAHVHGCEECAVEWALLRNARATLHAAAPQVDAAAIARAVSARLAAPAASPPALTGSGVTPALNVVRGGAARTAAAAPIRRPVRRWFTAPMQAAAAVVILAL